MFADNNVNVGSLKAPPESTIRVLTPEVVLVSIQVQVEGQKVIGRGEIEKRDDHSLRVLRRERDGAWLTVSEVYNDANRETTYAGGSRARTLRNPVQHLL